MIRAVVSSPSYLIAAAVGVVAAVVISPFVSVLTDAGMDAYDAKNPIATVQAVRVPSPPGEIRLTMTTQKHRDCELQRVFAYDKAADGTNVRTKIEKIEPGDFETIPPGERVRSIIWRVAPVTGTAIVVWAEHACGSRVVRTKLFEMLAGKDERFLEGAPG